MRTGRTRLGWSGSRQGRTLPSVPQITADLLAWHVMEGVHLRLPQAHVHVKHQQLGERAGQGAWGGLGNAVRPLVGTLHGHTLWAQCIVTPHLATLPPNPTTPPTDPHCGHHGGSYYGTLEGFPSLVPEAGLSLARVG